MPKLACIALTVIGLVLIVHSDKQEKTDYRSILLPLVLYMLSKYGYSLLIKGAAPYISSSLQLFFAMLIIAVVMLFFASFPAIFAKSKKGAAAVILTRIPNTAGTLLENAVIAISITSYSFIQPMVLVTLFLIELARKGSRRGKELAGSLICIAGIVLFLFV